MIMIQLPHASAGESKYLNNWALAKTNVLNQLIYEIQIFG